MSVKKFDVKEFFVVRCSLNHLGKRLLEDSRIMAKIPSVSALVGI